MNPELDALEAWLGRPLPAAFVAALEQHGGRLVEPGLLLYAADELLERNRAFETSLYCPGYLAIGDDSGGRAVVMPTAPMERPVAAATMRAAASAE